MEVENNGLRFLARKQETQSVAIEVAETSGAHLENISYLPIVSGITAQPIPGDVIVGMVKMSRDSEDHLLEMDWLDRITGSE